MKTLTFTTSIKFLSGLALIFTINASQNVIASELETVCKDHVQNKIAWNPNSPYESAQKWEKANLESLCKGTKTPEEPGECFHKVMTGHVKWGGSDKWEWKNAIALCAGTNDADVGCGNFSMPIEQQWLE
jgi:hypothetical protein